LPGLGIGAFRCRYVCGPAGDWRCDAGAGEVGLGLFSRGFCLLELGCRNLLLRRQNCALLPGCDRIGLRACECSLLLVKL
jgi:hypothetical protein